MKPFAHLNLYIRENGYLILNNRREKTGLRCENRNRKFKNCSLILITIFIHEITWLAYS